MNTLNKFIKKAKSNILIKKIKHSTSRNLLFGAKGLHNENIIIHCEKQNSEILPSTWIISINDITSSTLNLHKLLIDTISLEYYLELFNSLFAYIKEEASAIKNSMQTLIFHFPENFKEKSHFAEKLFLAVRQNFSFIKHYNYSYSSSKVSWILLMESLECFNDFIKIENLDLYIKDFTEQEEKHLIIEKIITKDYTYKYQTDYVILHSDITNKENFPSLPSDTTEKKSKKNKEDLITKLMEINQSDLYNNNIDSFNIDLFYNYSINATEFIKRINAINSNFILPILDDKQIKNIIEIKKASDIILKLLNYTYIDFAKIVEKQISSLTNFLDDNNINVTLYFFIKWIIKHYQDILNHSQVLSFDTNYENVIKFNFKEIKNFEILQTNKSKEVEVFKAFLDKFCNYVNIPEDDIINNNLTKEQRHKIIEQIEQTNTFYDEFTINSHGTTPFEFTTNISNFITAFVKLLPVPIWKTEDLKVNINNFKNDIHENTDEYKFKSLINCINRDYYENIITTDTDFFNEFFKDIEISKKEKSDIIKEFNEYNSNKKYIIDQINTEELNKIENQFKDIYNPLSADFNTFIDKNKELQKEFSDLFLYSPQREAVEQYSRNSKRFNSALRNNKSITSSIYLVDLIKTFFHADAKLKYPIVVLRGNKTDEWLKNKIAGDYVIESAFFSTTILYDIAVKFFTNYRGSNYSHSGILYEILIPAGNKGIYIEKITAIKEEYELLLPPGSLFKILSVENRVNNPDEKKRASSGLYYKLLYIGSATRDIVDIRLKDNDEWNKFKQEILDEKI